MVVQIACPNCGSQLKVAEKHLGRQGACPKCGHRFTLLPPGGAGPTTDSWNSAEEVSGKSTPPPVPGAMPPPVPESPVATSAGSSENEETYALREEPSWSRVPSEATVEGPQAELPRHPRVSSAPEDKRMESGPPRPIRRPLPVVLIVFYWVLCWGIPLLATGGVVSASGSLPGLASIIASEINEVRPSEAVGRFALAARIGMEVISVGGFLIFCYAVFLLATCYGLWTHQSWGVACGRRISVGNLVLAVLAFLWALITGWLSVLVMFTHGAISLLVALYLFGVFPSVDAFREYAKQISKRASERW